MVWGEIQSPLLGRCSNQLMCWTSLGSAKPCPVLGRWTSLGFAKPCPLLGRWTAGCTHPVHLYRCSRRSWHNACPSGSWHDKCPRHEKCPSRKCPGIRCSGRRFCRRCWGRFYCRCRGRQRCPWWGHWGSCLLPCDWTSPCAHNHVDNRATIVGRNHSEIFL